MGGGTTTTTKNDTGALSGEGESSLDFIKDYGLAMMEESGYEISQDEKTKYTDQSSADKYSSQISQYEDEIATNQAKLAEYQAKKATNRRAGGTTSTEDAQIALYEKKIKTNQYQLNQAQTNYDKLEKVTYTDYSFAKKPDARITAAIDQYGEGSAEAVAAAAQVKQEAAEMAELNGANDLEYAKIMNKIARGDMSYTPEQAAQVDKYIGPIKDVIKKNTDDLLSLADESYNALSTAMNDIGTEIDKTGFAVEDALAAVWVQTESGQTDMLTALKTANQSSENRAKFEFGLLSEQADKKAAQQAALLGLAPGSQAEKFQAQKLKSDALTSIQMGLAEQEANGALNIASDTANKKQSISLARVNLAETQGTKREGLSASRVNLLDQFYGKKEGILGNSGNAYLALEREKQSMLQDAGWGGLGGRASAYQAGKGFDLGQKTGEAAYNAGLASSQAGILNTEEQRTFAENTSTQTTKNNPGFLDAFTDILGAGAGVASTAVTAGTSLAASKASTGLTNAFTKSLTTYNS